MRKEIDPDAFNNSKIVFSNNKTQTSNMKWLRLTDIYPKLLKSGTYDIGGTFSDDVPEFWFIFSTDNLADNFMLNLFIANKTQSSFSLEISSQSNLIHLLSKNPPYRTTLPSSSKIVSFKNSPDNCYNHIATFSFNIFDVKELKERELLIPIEMATDYSEHAHGIENVSNLDHNFKSLLKDPVFSDFIIESCDGHQFKVHQAILASQSEVFKAMLKEETAESQNNKVQFHFSKEEIENLLQFIYTGSIDDITSCDCVNMLAMADLYDLPGLSLLAQNVLCQQINNDNAIDLLVLGDMHNSDLLKRAVLKYINKNPNALKSEGWKNLKDSNLIKSVTDAILIA